MANITIIGGGNMGEALIKGLRKSHRVSVFEINTARAKYLKEKYKVSIKDDIHRALDDAKVVIFAVKPQDMAMLLENIVGAGSPRPYGRLFISIAAGLTTKFFEKRLGKVRVVRAMPNMPALIGEGITGVCGGRYATAKDINFAASLLRGLGAVLPFEENMMDAVTAVSGSGPAYVFLFVEQWIAAARSLGLNAKDARNLVYETLIGSTHLLNKAACTAGDLRTKVTSKGGTTQAAMDVFFKGKFGQLMKKSLLAAKKRSQELAR